MTSKERVRLAFEHHEPDRVPLWYGASQALTEKICEAAGSGDEEALMQRLHIDFRRVRQDYIGPSLSGEEDGRSKNFWGVLRGGMEYGQPLSHPLAGAETLADLDRYNWPDPKWFPSKNCRAQCKKWADYSIIGGPWVVVWTDATELMGMEEYLMKMVTHPELIHALNKRVADFYWELALEFFNNCGDLLDIFFFGDDFGTQEALLISPAMWREFFKPILKRFSDLGHDFGMKTMFHSCGSVWSIIPDLIEIGMDGVNPVQPRPKGMDLASLKRDYGSRITFHGALDHQKILPFGTADEVRAEVRRVIDIMAPGGGFCLAASHDLMLADFPVENVIAMYDEAERYGRYKKR
ncbi:MAG: uroporphyrinogen decarboxylase family protein [Candidatus Latescibacterota bacterium]